jgi:indole-3-glycerol phosphate synthase
MSDILRQILNDKRGHVEQRKNSHPLEQLQAEPDYQQPRRDFRAAVTSMTGLAPQLIAEIKRRSPSAGLIREDFDPVQLARWYAESGAAALSVLTDEPYFDGRDAHIAQVKSTTKLPVLRKDFLIDPYQIHESRAIGADAILLIGEALETERLAEMASLAVELELAVLVEVHSKAVLDQVLGALPVHQHPHMLLGINNRDLKRQVTDIGHTEQLAQHVPVTLPLVAESGVKTAEDLRRMRAAGAAGVLIGETLLAAEDPRIQIADLYAQAE